MKGMRRSIPDEEIIDAYNNKRVILLEGIAIRLEYRLKLPRGKATDMLDKAKLSVVQKLIKELDEE